MTDRAPNPSRIRTVLAVVWAGAVVLGLAGCGAGAGARSGAAEEAQVGTTRTTVYWPEYLATTTTSLSPPATTPPATSATTSSSAPQAPGPAPETPSAQGPAVPAGDDTTVERIVDGDTIVVAGGIRVRFIGMNTPETRDPRTGIECFGPEASRHTTELLPAGTPVRLVYDVERTDQYGRTLAYVHRLSDGLFVNVALVRDGFAQVATYPPNVAHVDELRAAEAEARLAGRGLWAGCPAGGSTATTTTTVLPSPVGGGGACDPSYPDVCIPPAPPDLDCGQITYKRFRVVGADPHGFDGNNDGVGCEG